MIGFLRAWYSRRSLVARRLLLFGLALVASGLVLWFTPSPYYITAPGAAIDTGRLISVKGGQGRNGQLYMLVVTVQPANLFWYLYAKLDPRAVLETRQEFLGEIPNYEEYVELTRRMMEESQKTAKAIGMQLAGYGQGVRTVGVRVEYLTEGAPSQGYLQKGDVIVQVAGKAVQRASEFQAVARSLAAGVRVPMRVRRGGAIVELSVPTGEHPERKGEAYFGIVLGDELEFDMPVQVDIKSGFITGPSAGLMFTLQIVDQLTPGGIAGGHIIAGTGTIEVDGRVGNIGGVQQKVYTAETAGAEVMFVPRGNYEEARKVASRIQLIPVDNVRDALQWLRANRKAGLGALPFAYTGMLSYRSQSLAISG